MKKLKSRRNLVASGFSLVLCLAMLIGTTFAWFSDSVSNKGNRIQAGNLKVGFSASDALDGDNLSDTNLVNLADPDAHLFNLTNWGPGSSYTRYMRVKNTGTLPLKYDIDFVLSGNNSLADSIKIDVSSTTATVTNGSVSASQAENIGMSGEINNINDYQIFKLDLTFVEGAGNTYNGSSMEFELDVNLSATQKNAPNPIKAKTVADLKKATENSTIIFRKNITLTEDIALPYCNMQINGYTLDLGGHTLTIDGKNAIGTSDINDGAVKNGVLVINAPVGTVNTDCNYTDVDIQIDAISSNTFVFKGTTNRSIVIKQGKIEIKNDTPITISVPSDANGVIVVDSRETVVNKVTVDVTNGATGTVVVSKPDEPINVTGTGAGSVENTTSGTATWLNLAKGPTVVNGDTYQITTPEELAWVSQKVLSGNSFEGKTINLSTDIDLSGKGWAPIGAIRTIENDNLQFTPFNGTFNGNGHKITGIEIGTSSAYDTKDYATGLFGFTGDKSIITGVNAEVAIYTESGMYVGGFIAGSAGAISGCSVNGVIKSDSTENTVESVGGFADVLDDGSSIINCKADTDIFVGNAGNYGIGNFVGMTRAVSNTVIANCYSSGTIDGGKRDAFTTGGFIGYAALADKTKIINCHSNTTSLSIFIPTVQEGGSFYEKFQKGECVNGFYGWYEAVSSKGVIDHSFYNNDVVIKYNDKIKTNADQETATRHVKAVDSLSASEMNNYWTADNIPSAQMTKTGLTIDDMKIWKDGTEGFPVF